MAARARFIIKASAASHWRRNNNNPSYISQVTTSQISAIARLQRYQTNIRTAHLEAARNVHL